MKKRLLSIFSIATMSILIATPAFAATPAEELTEALHEVIQPALQSEPFDIAIKVNEYRVVNGHLADFRVEYSMKLPVLELDGDLAAYEGKKVMLSSANKLDVKDKALLQKQPIKPMTKEEWDTHVLGVEKEMKDPNHLMVKEGIAVDFKPLRTNDKKEIEEFEVVFRPTEKNKSLLFDVRLVIAVENDAFTCNLILENNGRSKTVFDQATEKQVVDFLENIRQRDMATMMMAQSMMHLLKGYAGMVLSQVAAQ